MSSCVCNNNYTNNNMKYEVYIWYEVRNIYYHIELYYPEYLNLVFTSFHAFFLKKKKRFNKKNIIIKKKYCVLTSYM